MFEMIKRSAVLFLAATVILASFNVPAASAGEMVLPLMPKPGTMVNISPSFVPAHLQGIVIHPDNALQFDFLIHKGDGNLTQAQKKEEYTKLIKYFLASLTVPDEDQWVNLSPYEKDRIIKDDFGKTEMGRILLAQDYLLKQIASSLMYPESGLGKSFWDKVYAELYRQYTPDTAAAGRDPDFQRIIANVGTVNTFNKVWIIPDEATIYESGNTAYIVKQHLKVMMDEDYLSLKKHSGITSAPNQNHAITSKVIKEVILPAIEKEVNEGRNFAQLRQVASSMVLATWYKKALKESLLGKVFADKAKTAGVSQDPKNNEVIYQQYLQAFKKGVYNYIKEDTDKYTNQVIPRKYFAGGVVREPAMISISSVSEATFENIASRTMVSLDSAMTDIASVSTNRTMVGNAEDGSYVFRFPDQREYDFSIHQNEAAYSLGPFLYFSVPTSGSTEELIKSKIMQIKKRELYRQHEQDVLFVSDISAVPRQPLNSHVAAVIATMLDHRDQFKDATVVDLGSGTGVLSSTILKLGARNAILVDNDVYLNGKARLFLVENGYKERDDQGHGNFNILNADLDDINQVLDSLRTLISGSKRIIVVINIGAWQHYGSANMSALRIAAGLGAGLIINGGHLSKDKPGYGEHRKALEGFKAYLSSQGYEVAEMEFNPRKGDDPNVVLSGSRVAAEKKKDPSIVAQDNASTGGIDLNAANMAMVIKRDGKGVPLPLAQQDMAQLSHIQGFEPHILEIRPVSALSILNDH